MMKKSSLFLAALTLISGLSATAVRADEKVEVTSLDSISLDKAGRLRVSYTVSGGCERHEASVEIELRTEDAGVAKYARAAKIRVFDLAQREDRCNGSVPVATTIQLGDALQSAADAEGALIEDRRMPISISDVSVFTGK